MAVGVAVFWLVLSTASGSVTTATVLLGSLAGLGVVGVMVLRFLDTSGNHPWIRQLASRPWRDGQYVLNSAMRHLSDVFVITPSGSLLAPNVVELQLNPGDLASLCERTELGVIGSSMTEVYEERVADHGARFAGSGRADVYLTASGDVPPGRYRLRQGQPGRRPTDVGAQHGQRRPAVHVMPSARRLLLAATRLLPAAERDRYTEEYASELWEIARASAGRRPQIRYALNQLTRAPQLRSAARAHRKRRATP